MAKVTLDAGHGGSDPGAVGNGLREKDITLKITLMVGEILKKHGVNVNYTRKTDKFVSLYGRAAIANKFGADLFVSIHCNSASSSGARGVEVFSYPGSGSGMQASKNVLEAILENGSLYAANRGNKTAYFTVLSATAMDAILVETAFISNQYDAQILTSKQKEFAEAIAKGILKHFGIAYKNKPPETEKAEDHWAYQFIVKFNKLAQTIGFDGFKDFRLEEPIKRGEFLRIMSDFLEVLYNRIEKLEEKMKKMDELEKRIERLERKL